MLVKRLRSLRLGLGALTAMAVAAIGFPAYAADSYVHDGAGMLSASTVEQIDSQVGAFHARTGKEVVVVTVPSLNGTPINDAVERAFAQYQVNGVMIFLTKAEQQGRVVGDRASQAFFAPGSFQAIYDGMRGYFKAGDFDTGVKTGVKLTLEDYQSHARSGGLAPAQAPIRTAPIAAPSTSSFGGMNLLWLFVILIVGFFVIRAIFRAMAGPRPMPPGYGGQPPGGAPMGGYGPGYGTPGYGGGGMGGGGFFSGLLGGLGGAFLGNELFGGRRDNPMGGGDVSQAGMAGEAQPDSAGWQSDAGQIDSGNMGGGDFGGGGGWGDSGGGGGDFGGGGGGDSGGGW